MKHGTQQEHERERPVGELLKRALRGGDDARRKEIELAKAELAEKGKAGMGAGMFGGPRP